MQTAKPEIKMARAANGWAWTLIDARGETAARGSAGEQAEAMEAAWRLARSTEHRSWRDYPEIIVE